jgi:hypothetical protein
MRHYQELTGESPRESATAESSTTIASVGALQTQAQRLPLPPPPSLSALAPHSTGHAYHHQATDYVALLSDDDTDEKNS